MYSASQALKRHLNLCKNLPKNAVSNSNETEFDFSTVDVTDPIYDTVCICCNEEKETAHVCLGLSFWLSTTHMHMIN